MEGRNGKKKKCRHLFYSSSNNTLVAVLAKATTVPPASAPSSPSGIHAAAQQTRSWHGSGGESRPGPLPGLVHHVFVKVLVPAQPKRQQQGEKTGKGKGKEMKRVQDSPHRK